MDIIKNEPITIATVTTIISWLAVRFALDMDAKRHSDGRSRSPRGCPHCREYAVTKLT